MKKKIILALGIIIIMIALAITYIYGYKKETKYITKYEWANLLVQELGIREHKSNIPYFEDVLIDNEYFSDIQALKEWELLEDSAMFYGEDCVTGRYIALTLMKTIQSEKIQIFLDGDEDITEETYLSLAIKLDIIKRSELEKFLSLKEVYEILERYRDVYFNKFWFDNYADVKYATNVYEIESKNILYINSTVTKIMVSKEVFDKISLGKVIVFEYNENGSKCARKIVNIESDGSLILSTDFKISDVVESFVVSDVEEVTFDDIIQEYITKNTSSNMKNMVCYPKSEKLLNTSLFSGTVENEGFKITLSKTSKVNSEEKDNTEEDDDEGETKEKDTNIKEVNSQSFLKITITDNSTGISSSIVTDIEVEKEEDVEAEINIKKMYIGTQAMYSATDGLKYVDVAIQSDIIYSGKLSCVKKEKTIPLFETSVPLGNGLVQAKIIAMLEISGEGSISFKTNLPLDTSIYYEKNKGIRSLKNEVMIEDPRIDINCEGNALFGLEPVICFLDSVNIMDAKVDTGIVVSADAIIHNNFDICRDIFIAVPVLNLSIGQDEDIDTILDEVGISVEWKIIKPEDALIKKNIHVETYGDGPLTVVEKCTYEEDTEIEVEKEEANQNNANEEYSDLSRFYEYGLPLGFTMNAAYVEDTSSEEYDASPPTDIYSTAIEESLIDCGEYYVIEGTIECLECIETAVIYEVGEGGHFETISGNGYTIGSSEIYNETSGREKINLLGDDGRNYAIYNIPASNRDIYTEQSYYIIVLEETMQNVITQYTDVKFYIDKSTQITRNKKLITDNFDGTFGNYIDSNQYMQVPLMCFDIRIDGNGKLLFFDTASNMRGYFSNSPEIRIQKIK